LQVDNKCWDTTSKNGRTPLHTAGKEPDFLFNNSSNCHITRPKVKLETLDGYM